MSDVPEEPAEPAEAEESPESPEGEEEGEEEEKKCACLFSLEHDKLEDFCRSQWQKEETCCWFLIYRWLMAACFCSGCISCMINYFDHGLWFIYMTNWGFCMCAITSLLGAVITTAYQRDPEGTVARTKLLKFYWVCYWTNLVMSHVIALVYWACIYPEDRAPSNKMRTSDLYNYWTHALPVVLFNIDHLLSAMPARLGHFVYPMSLSFVYTGFTYVYFKRGGCDPMGRPNLYPFLKWDKPVETLLNSGIVSTLFLGVSIFHYGVFRIRSCFASKEEEEVKEE